MDNESTEPSQDPEEALRQLRRWQDEQRARLIEQQKQQRELLLEKQKKLLSMLNSAGKGPPSDDDSLNVPEVLRNNTLEDDDGHQGPSTPKTIDEVPLKKPRALQSFEQIMENSLNSKDAPPVSSPEAPERKFTFLKRGEGISKRFGRVPNITLKKGHPKASKAVTRQNSGKENREPPKAEPPISKSLSSRPPSLCQTSTASTRSSRDTCSDSEPLPAVPPPQPEHFVKQTTFEKQEKTALDRAASLDEECIESLRNFHVPYQMRDQCITKDAGVSHNEEELAVFELLERFASINASFSSSSSLIGQLIEKGVNHLPSPSKVIEFLSKKRLEPPETEQAGPHLASKAQKKVHFAEILEEQRDDSCVGLDNLTAENADGDYSPYVSNTLHCRPHADEESPIPAYEPKSKHDESPASPIGFPDYKKLFGNPVRTLWAREELPSPGQDEDTGKESHPSESHEDDSEILKSRLTYIYLSKLLNTLRIF